MEKILPLLDELKYEELHQLGNLLDEKIKICDDQNLILHLQNEIKTKGYACTIKSVNKSKICDKNILSVEFPVYVVIYTHICKRENKTDLHLGDLCDEQNDWVEYLGFNDIPTDDDNWKLITEKNEWYNNYDDGNSYGKAVVKVTIFYQKAHKPKEGEQFECFNKDGNLEKWEVEDGELYCKGEYYGKLYMWNYKGLFVYVPH